jgi:hypothetical protein
MASQEPQFQIRYSESNGYLQCSSEDLPSTHEELADDYLVVLKFDHTARLAGLRIIGWRRVLRHFLDHIEEYPADLTFNTVNGISLKDAVHMAYVCQCLMNGVERLVGTSNVLYGDAEAFSRRLRIPATELIKALPPHRRARPSAHP